MVWAVLNESEAAQLNKPMEYYTMSSKHHEMKVTESEAVVNKAREMLDELKSNFPEAVLIPAAEQKHHGHQIRVVQYANCKWYREFCALYMRPRPVKARTIISRQTTIAALKRIIDGTQHGSMAVYRERLLDYVNRELKRGTKVFDPDTFDLGF